MFLIKGLKFVELHLIKLVGSHPRCLYYQVLINYLLTRSTFASLHSYISLFCASKMRLPVKKLESRTVSYIVGHFALKAGHTSFRLIHMITPVSCERGRQIHTSPNMIFTYFSKFLSIHAMLRTCPTIQVLRLGRFLKTS